MAIQDTRILAGLAGSFSLGVLLQILGCVLWHNWWPMLTAFMYVMVPMPYLFFGGGGDSSYSGGSSLVSGWIDAGKFLTGFSAVGSIAIPAILYHADVIHSRTPLFLRTHFPHTRACMGRPHGQPAPAPVH